MYCVLVYEFFVGSYKHVSETPMNKIIKCANKLCMEIECR